jgi:hypothetical protein
VARQIPHLRPVTLHQPPLRFPRKESEANKRRTSFVRVQQRWPFKSPALFLLFHKESHSSSAICAASNSSKQQQQVMQPAAYATNWQVLQSTCRIPQQQQLNLAQAFTIFQPFWWHIDHLQRQFRRWRRDLVPSQELLAPLHRQMSHANEDLDEEFEEFIEGPDSDPITIVTETPMAIAFSVNGESNIPSDGVDHQVSVAVLPFSAKISYIAIPRIDPRVFLQVTFFLQFWFASGFTNIIPPSAK